MSGRIRNVFAFMVLFASLSACRVGESTGTNRADTGDPAPDTHAVHRHDFDSPEQRAEERNSSERDEWQKPDEVIELMDLQPGHAVVDLGTGTGYFLPHLSDAVGPEGEVLALDISEEMIDYVDRHVRPELPHDNLDTRLVAPDDPGLETDSVGRILTVNAWHHVDNRVVYAEKIADALAPDGRFVVVDYTREADRGSPDEIRLRSEEVVEELEAAGLRTKVVEESLPRQYVVVATPEK